MDYTRNDVVGMEEMEILAWQGRLDPAWMSHIISKTASAMQAQSGSGRSVIHKTTTIAIEVLQNLYRHVENHSRLEAEAKIVEFGIRCSGGNVYITSGNHMLMSDARALRDRIEQINSRSRDELKEWYRSVLAGNDRGRGEGSGLGLLRVATLSQNRLKCEILPEKEGLAFFKMVVTLQL